MSQSYSSVAVVGGGAAGMMAALTAAEVPGRHVMLLERQQRIGRKLLATGNGRCNLSNRDAGPADYFGTDPSFAAYALTHFRSVDTQRFFAHLGLLTTTEPDGRIYPLSDSSNSVLDVLRFGLDRAGVEQRCSFPVEEIQADRRGFTLRSGVERVHAEAVILACGGAAGAKLGGVTDGYRLGKALGHRRSSLYPSLTRILTDPEYPRSLKGIRVQAALKLTRQGRVLAQSRGEVQFTETGISGPAGFDLSRSISFGGEGQTLHLQLLPFEEEAVFRLVQARQKQFPDLEASELFTGMLHNRLGRVVVKAAGLSAAAPLSSLSEAELRQAAGQCTDFRLPVRGVDGFDAAQVTAGGLLTEGFDPETMQSRIHPGLFACGEVLDIDGPCGGYNLQWAWASGRLAGRLGE